MGSTVTFSVDGFGSVEIEINTLDALLLAAMIHSASKNDTELADVLGVSRMTLYTWRSGTWPSDRHLTAILRVAGLPTCKIKTA